MTVIAIVKMQSYESDAYRHNKYKLNIDIQQYITHLYIMLEVWVGESVTLFFPWAGEVVVSFDWARDVMGCVRCSVSCAETLFLLKLQPVS